MLMIELTESQIDAERIRLAVSSPKCGAIVLFLGTTRQFTDAKETLTLSYTAYSPMARSQMEKLAAQAQARWPVEKCAIAHRLGEVPIGEASGTAGLEIHRGQLLGRIGEESLLDL